MDASDDNAVEMDAGEDNAVLSDDFDDDTVGFDEDSRTCDEKSSESLESNGALSTKIYKFKTPFPDTAVCFYCSASFTSRLETKTHIRNVHAREIMYQCPHCSYRVKEKSRLLRHISNVHKTKNEFDSKPKGKKKECTYDSLNIRYDKCRYCFMEIMRRNMATHLSVYHRINYKPYSCVYCSFQTGKLNNLCDHLQKEHTDLKKYSCSHCDYRCVKLMYLKRHNLTKHKNAFEGMAEEEIMKQLGKNNGSDGSSEDEGNIYACDQCSYVAPNKQQLSRHMVRIHQEKCWSVNRRDKTKKSVLIESDDVKNELGEIKVEEDINRLKNGVVIDSKIKSVENLSKAEKETFYCTKCNFFTIHLSLYNEHIACAHNKTMEEREQALLYCEYCSFSTVYPHSVKRHYETVHFKINRKIEIVKAYQCDYCRDIFGMKIRLRRHVEKLHDIDKPYNCSICDYKAAKRDQLEKHMGLHI